jgi:L-amino acid N-acyltransferase YncA
MSTAEWRFRIRIIRVMAKRIRRAAATDAETIRRIYAPFVADMATSFETVPPDITEIERRLATHGDRYPWIVFENAGEVLGYAYASAHNERHAYQWSVNVSVYIDPRAHRSGVGRALYTALFELLRRQRFVNAYGGITLPNPASVGLHESLGFVPVGTYSRVGFKFGTWHDVMWLHLRLADAPAPPGDPLPIARLFHDEGVRAVLDACAESVRMP